MSSSSSPSAQKIRIVARLRPRISAEPEDESVKVVRGSPSYINIVNPRDTSQVFKFQFANCYDESSTQEEIFANDVLPMIDLFYQGLTVTIFAYGVTSSGKTHTMQGSKSQPGVIPRTVQAIFRKKDHLCEATPSAQVSICMAYMEIYKDDVYDLLVTRENAPKLPVRENEHGKVFVANLTYEPLSTSTEFDALYARANKHRSVGATNLNRASSRSHAILLLRTTITDPTSNRTLTGTINLVDLAGSENNKLTGNDPSRMAESAAINKSLSVLGQVVHALNSNQSRIPYRNSKLTRILQDALGGSSVGLLICNLAPGAKFRQDTLNTLNFASRTKNIENKPVVNEEENRPKPTFHAPPNPQRAGSHSRQSLLPAPKIPRASAVAHGGPGFQPLALQPQLGIKQEPSAVGLTLTESELNEKVAKAVEAEVARRMVEIERQRQQEREEQEKKAQEALEAARQRPQSIAEIEADVDKENRWHRRAKSRSPKKEPTHSVLPPGVLSPPKKHKELEGDLRSRLQELEQRFDRGNTKDAPDVLSPVSKKKIGRAYVAAARSHSEKGDLQAALELYRKAETYVPDNIKLKERIIEIDWAVKNGRPFAPSPKPKKKKASGSKSRRNASTSQSDTGMDVDQDDDSVGTDGRRRKGRGGPRRGDEFGMEVTNNHNNSPGRYKRHRGFDSQEGDDRDEEMETPPKRLRRSKRGKSVAAAVESDDDDEGYVQAPVKKGKRKVMPH